MNIYRQIGEPEIKALVKLLRALNLQFTIGPVDTQWFSSAKVGIGLLSGLVEEHEMKKFCDRMYASRMRAIPVESKD
jgi:hypothetical protein